MDLTHEDLKNSVEKDWFEFDIQSSVSVSLEEFELPVNSSVSKHPDSSPSGMKEEVQEIEKELRRKENEVEQMHTLLSIAEKTNTKLKKKITLREKKLKTMKSSFGRESKEDIDKNIFIKILQKKLQKYKERNQMLVTECSELKSNLCLKQKGISLKDSSNSNILASSIDSLGDKVLGSLKSIISKLTEIESRVKTLESQNSITGGIVELVKKQNSPQINNTSSTFGEDDRDLNPRVLGRRDLSSVSSESSLEDFQELIAKRKQQIVTLDHSVAKPIIQEAMCKNSSLIVKLDKSNENENDSSSENESPMVNKKDSDIIPQDSVTSMFSYYSTIFEYLSTFDQDNFQPKDFEEALDAFLHMTQSYPLADPHEVFKPKIAELILFGDDLSMYKTPQEQKIFDLISLKGIEIGSNNYTMLAVAQNLLAIIYLSHESEIDCSEKIGKMLRTRNPVHFHAFYFFKLLQFVKSDSVEESRPTSAVLFTNPPALKPKRHYSLLKIILSNFITYLEQQSSKIETESLFSRDALSKKNNLNDLRETATYVLRKVANARGVVVSRKNYQDMLLGFKLLFGFKIMRDYKGMVFRMLSGMYKGDKHDNSFEQVLSGFLLRFLDSSDN